MTRRRESRRPEPVGPHGRTRPGEKATLHVLAPVFVHLSTAERAAAIEALAALLAERDRTEGPVTTR